MTRKPPHHVIFYPLATSFIVQNMFTNTFKKTNKCSQKATVNLYIPLILSFSIVNYHLCPRYVLRVLKIFNKS